MRLVLLISSAPEARDFIFIDNRRFWTRLYLFRDFKILTPFRLECHFSKSRSHQVPRIVTFPSKTIPSLLKMRFASLAAAPLLCTDGILRQHAEQRTDQSFKTSHRTSSGSSEMLPCGRESVRVSVYCRDGGHAHHLLRQGPCPQPSCLYHRVQ